MNPPDIEVIVYAHQSGEDARALNWEERDVAIVSIRDGFELCIVDMIHDLKRKVLLFASPVEGKKWHVVGVSVYRTDYEDDQYGYDYAIDYCRVAEKQSRLFE